MEKIDGQGISSDIRQRFSYSRFSIKESLIMVEYSINKNYGCKITDCLWQCKNISQGEYHQTSRCYPFVSKPLDVFVVVHLADYAKAEKGRVFCKEWKAYNRRDAVMGDYWKKVTNPVQPHCYYSKHNSFSTFTLLEFIKETPYGRIKEEKLK